MLGENLVKKSDNKITWVCLSCGAELKRKVTEARPQVCNFCHDPQATFAAPDIESFKKSMRGESE